MLNEQKKKYIKELRAYADKMVEEKIGNPMEIYRIVLDGASAINESDCLKVLDDTGKAYFYRLSEIKIGKERIVLKHELKALASEMLEAEKSFKDDILRTLEEADAAFDACLYSEDLMGVRFAYADKISRCNSYDQFRIYEKMISDFLSTADLHPATKVDLMDRARNSLLNCESEAECKDVLDGVKIDVEYFSTSIDVLKNDSKNRLLEKAKEYMNIDNLGALYIALSEAFVKIDECRELYQIELLEQDIILLIGEYNVKDPSIKR